MKKKKVFIALKMSGIAGQAKLAGIFRYLNKKYSDNSIWEIHLVRTRNDLTEASLTDAIQNNTDGFKIAEKDLEMRGSGDFFGTRQSGKMLTDIKNLRYPTSVIFMAKRLSDDAFEGRYDDERMRVAALKKYESLKDVVMN